MTDNYKEVISLTDEVPESKYSGLSDLPEVKDPVAFLMGTKSRGEFRSMVLDEVIPQRKRLPEWATTTDYKTTGQKAIKATGVFSAGIVGGDPYELNKVGEAFYSIKDGLASFFYDVPRQIGTIVGASTKASGSSEESSTSLLKYLNDLKKRKDFEKSVEDFRLGVDSEFMTNKFGNVVGNAFGIVVTSALTDIPPAVLEGIQEGGSYLETDITAQRERAGGLKEYKGEGLGFAAAHGALSYLIGKQGAESLFIKDLKEKSTKDFIKSLGEQIGKSAKAEFVEEAFQTTDERAARRAQNELYGTSTDKQTYLEDILSIGEAALLGAAGGASMGGVQFVNNMHYMAEQLQDNFGLTKADAKLMVKQYMDMNIDAIKRNGAAMKDMAPNSRVMQLAKQQLVQDGQTPEEADKTLERVRKDIIKEQIKKKEELSANEFFTQTETPEGLTAYIREKAGIQKVEDSVVEEEKQQIQERRVELEQQLQEEQKAETTAAEETSVQTTEETVAEEQKVEEKPTEKPVAEETSVQTTEETVAEEQKVEEKPTEKPVAEEKSSPVQLEMNFLNAQENAINKAMDIEAPELPVNQDLLTKQDVQKINDKLEEIETKVDDLSTAKTPAQKEEYDAGKQLNSFVKPKTAVSKFSERVAKQTSTEGVEPVRHSVRDMASAKKDADALVNTNEDAAWEILENERADTRGLLKSEVAEALKRKISKIKDANTRKEQLRRLINAYADVATRLGQEFRALADDSLVDAIRDAAMIEAKVSKKIEKAVKNKSAKVQKTIDNLVKSDRVMSDKRFWEQVREKMECRI